MTPVTITLDQLMDASLLSTNYNTLIVYSLIYGINLFLRNIPIFQRQNVFVRSEIYTINMAFPSMFTKFINLHYFLVVSIAFMPNLSPSHMIITSLPVDVPILV